MESVAASASFRWLRFHLNVCSNVWVSHSVTGISPLNGQLPPMLWLTWLGPPLWWFRDTLSARYYRQPQWHRVKITPDTIITSHSGSAFQNSSDPGCQPRTRRTDIGGCWTPDSDYPGIVFCVNISGLTMAQKLAWSPHFLRPFDAVFAITPWNRETGGHMWPLVRGKLRDQIDLGREGQTIFQDKIVWRMRQQWVPAKVLKIKMIFGSDRSSRSHNLWAFVWFKFV